jgi:hypothetical protein
MYIIVQLRILSYKVVSYNETLDHSVPVTADRRKLRQRLDPFIFVQLLVGLREVQADLTMVLLRAMVAITVALGPILLLLQIQCTFLPYHLSSITWFHRLMVLIDILLLCSFWPTIRYGVSTSFLPSFRSYWSMYCLSILAIMFSGLVATFPGEQIQSLTLPNALTKIFFQGPVDLVSGKPRSLLSNVLVLPGLSLVDGSGARTFSLRGRDFVGAVFIGSDLRGADFSGAKRCSPRRFLEQCPASRRIAE